jgi:Family of unknown function (DUF5317)/Major Facilitator Superfamily
MFLLPSLVLGLAVALLLGGRVSRLLEVPLRRTWLVVAALAVQLALFGPVGHAAPHRIFGYAHIATYVLLLAFVVANRARRSLLPLAAGVLLNGIAISANGGWMPVGEGALHALGEGRTSGANVSVHAERLRFLGDVFALPRALPLANVFSVGDVLIGLGMVVFVVVTALAPERESLDLRGLVAPLRQGAYRRLALGRLVSYAGDWLTLAALVEWTYRRHGSTAQVAALLLVRTAPPILGGGLAGFVVDRLRKERVLVGVELARGCAVGLAILGVVGGSEAVVLAALGLSGAIAAIGRAAMPALLPSLLPPEQLPAANASMGVAEDAAMALGALVAGASATAVGAPGALACDVLTFVLAAGLFASVRLRARDRDAAPRGTTGVRYLRGQPALLVLVGTFAAATLATGMVTVTLPRLVDSDLGLAGGYGFGFGALAAGLAVGQALAGFAGAGREAGRFIGVGLAATAVSLLLLAMTEHLPTALLLLACAGAADGTTDVLFKTAVQRTADPRHYGAVFGLAGASMRATMIGGILFAPIANTLLDPREVIGLAGVLLAVAAALAVFTGAHRARSRVAAATA